MTVIALRSGMLVADTMLATARVNCGRIEKVARCETAAGGAAGSAVMISRFLGWIRAGAPDNSAKQFDVDGFVGLLIRNRQIRIYEKGGFMVPKLERGFYAIGSGAEGALCAMLIGATALAAVRAVCDVVPFCGGAPTLLDVADLLEPAP